MLDKIVKRFEEQAPVSVMGRMMLERAALPGCALAVYDPDTELVPDMAACALRSATQ